MGHFVLYRQSVSVSLLLDWLNLLVWARGYFALREWALRAESMLREQWVWPGLVLALLFIVSHRGRAARDGRSGLQRTFRRPRLERFSEVHPSHHQDLEV